MSDLISRRVAIKALDERCESECEYSKKQRSIMCDACYLGSAKEVIEALPTVNAVPVVRCKDCRWKEREEPGMVYCPAVVGGWVDEDWFCKGGERSEE